MGTKSKLFRVFVEGNTISDGRTVTAEMIDQAVETFSLETYTPRINIEHISGYSPEPPFNGYGDVIAVEARTDDFTIDGQAVKRRALYAQVDANDQLVSLANADQKPFPSVELTPSYAGTNKFGLLQDVNKGWIQNTRDDAPARILSAGKHGADGEPAIYVSATGTADYVNLDALVFDALMLLDEQHRRRTDLVVLVSDELVHDKKFALINTAGDKATEQLARDVLLLQDKIGGKLAATVPNFPAGTIVITTYKNLSIYNQEGTRRRLLLDNPRIDAVENFESVNEAYVVEDYGLIAVVENIKMEAAPEAPEAP